MLDPDKKIGYIRISSFIQSTGEEVRKALETLKEQGAKGIVLDLRDNPGGLLQEAVGICRLFVESGTLVTTRRDDQTVKKEHLADGSTAGLDVPIAVLVNRGTASASEIVAACLQDHRLATIVGQRTYGKGTVQEVIELPWGQGALRLTTSSYWRPSGVNINRRKDASEKEEWGVSPDPGCAVKLTGAQIEKLIRWRQQRRLDQANGANRAEPQTELDVDPQLARAVQSVLARLKPAPPRSP